MAKRAKAKTLDLFDEIGAKPCTYEVHLHPPEYPTKCFPSRCRHDPEFVMQADVQIVEGKKHKIEIDHRVCFACGASLDATHGGNVLVDLQMLWNKLGWHMQLGMRIIYLRDKWARIARHLFDESGWTGKHERIARLIDPNLTMKILVEKIEHIGGTDHVGVMRFDKSYLREAA